MNWKDYTDGVKSLLTVENKRLGVGVVTNGISFVDKMIRHAVLDLQKNIRSYRMGHETLYEPADFAIEGYASIGTMPPFSTFRTVNICYDFSTDKSACRRIEPAEFPWENRMDLVCNKPNGSAFIAIDPYSNTFYIFPSIKDCQVLSVYWDADTLDGIKQDFFDEEEVPFPEQSQMAVSEFVLAKISRHVQRDINLHNSYWSTYLSSRSDLLLSAKERNMV